MSDKVTVSVLKKKKQSGEKIVALTAYDASAAVRVERAGIDLVLVGDSVGMTLLGYETTVPVTLEDILHHTKAVARGLKRSLLVADMPFLSFGVDPVETVRNAGRLIKEGGACAVKLEGGKELAEEVVALTRAGIPVLGHIGLHPQHILVMGEYSVKGKDQIEAKQLREDAMCLEEAGAFGLVLECVPSGLARMITEDLHVPTIGIGAGLHCDGQILVFQDLLGLTEGRKPKFVKTYAQLGKEVDIALLQYTREVREGHFPNGEHSY